LVFITKSRHRVFDGAIKRLRGLFSDLAQSSRMLRQKRPDLGARYWKGVLWSPSYFAASCGGHLSTLKDYIRKQKTPL
jgi:REP element-mobilizing transposase RayT